MKFAYADPPYPGQAKKHYSHDPNCAEVDHQELINQMCIEYDSWALSTSSPALQAVLSFCPDDVRVGAWVKPFCSFKKGVNPAYTWEPVILWHGRNPGSDVPTVKDHVIESITMKKGLAGVKPVAFCYWLFEFAGLLPSDEFYDLFPGSGQVSDCWEVWKRRKLNKPVQVGLFI